MNINKTDKKYLKSICKRQNIELTQNKVNNTYDLDIFVNTIQNSIPEVFTMDYFLDLFKNLDMTNEFIESSHIIKKYNDYDYDFLVIFRHLGKQFGALKKYLCFNIKQTTDQYNNIIFNAVNIDYTSDAISHLDKVILHYADLTVVCDKTDNRKAWIHNNFNVEIDKNLSKIVLNFINLVMKNMVINLKRYIDTTL